MLVLVERARSQTWLRSDPRLVPFIVNTSLGCYLTSTFHPRLGAGTLKKANIEIDYCIIASVRHHPHPASPYAADAGAGERLLSDLAGT